VSIPVSVDIEGGYSDDPAAVGELVAQIIAAGAVGINLEDGSSAPDLLCAKIETVKRTCSRLGVDLFVNARTDVFLRGLAPESARVDETMARGALYRAAGADGIFVPALVDAQDIKAIISGLHLPLNVMARPSLPPASELSALGVRRLSAGSGIAEAAYGRASTLAAGFLRDGASSSLGENAMSYAQINGLMAAG
jgi:2-methylisocitrate lyase-like PEP mutase family enzyme